MLLLPSRDASLFTALRRRLTERNDPEWLREFLKLGGLGLILESLSLDPKDRGSTFEATVKQVECVAAVRSIMDARIGLDYIVDNKEYTHKLATGESTVLFFRDRFLGH